MEQKQRRLAPNHRSFRCLIHFLVENLGVSALTVSQSKYNHELHMYKKLIPNRPSRGAISQVALLAEYSRVGPAYRTDDSVRLAPVLLVVSACHMAPTSSGPRKVRTNRLATERLADSDVRRTYQDRLLGSLSNAPPSEVNAHWYEIATSLHSAKNFACGTAPPGALKHWISDRAVALPKSRRNIQAGPERNLVRRIIRRQVKVSAQADREVWWTQKAKETESPRRPVMHEDYFSRPVRPVPGNHL
ncbi:ATP-binding cassette transporter [Clonorchis sinensis]|uniref:ATP-binding cassette transporter n=1 Tax=Clonorchis sinensis TaxID=79923 RepID=G7YJN1_CLOSI|nr:ATP-binding cassette transporter [Clonorchis sinensis]